jgi:hypothetical protein
VGLSAGSSTGLPSVLGYVVSWFVLAADIP